LAEPAKIYITMTKARFLLYFFRKIARLEIVIALMLVLVLQLSEIVGGWEQK
jgi:hypothetical protein